MTDEQNAKNAFHSARIGIGRPGMASELQTRTLRRVSLRIVPFVMLLYFIAFIDRVNIGFAALTMNKDLGFSPTVFGFGAGIFFFGYFLFEVPSNLILEQGRRADLDRPGHDHLGPDLGCHGVRPGCRRASTCFASCSARPRPASFRASSSISRYWFPARQRAAVTALFMAAAPLSTVLGSPVSAALLEHARRARPHGLAMDVPHRGGAGVLLGVVVLGST